MQKTNLSDFVKNIPRDIFFIAIAVLLNLSGHYLSETLNLPIWLDCVGTCLAAYYTNAFGAVLSSVSVSVIMGLSNPVMFLYSIPAALCAIAIRLLIKFDYLNTFTSVMLTSVGIAILSIAMNIPLNMAFQDGYTGNIWGDALYDMLEFKEVDQGRCASAASSIVEFVDKQISMLLAYLLIKGINKFISKTGSKFLKGFTTSSKNILSIFLAMGIMLSGTFGLAVEVDAVKKDDSVYFSDYIKTIYDAKNGLPASSVNIIEQTPDGYIWMGGYSGLYRYDGQHFTHIKDGSLANVTAMVIDGGGRLLVGTNDQGIAVFEDGKLTYKINKKSGLPENAIRTMFKSRNGDIYVGTIGKTCRIKPDGTINQFEDIFDSARSFAENKKGQIACVDFDGNLTIMKNDVVIATNKLQEEHERFSSVVATDNNEFLVGTSSNFILRMDIIDGELTEVQRISLGNLVNTSWIEKDSSGAFWICTYNGIGYLPKGEYTVKELKYQGFDNAIEDVIQDYEGNYWFASSSYGAMKLCKSSFADIYSYLEMEKKVVNAIEEKDGYLYCGTDTGLDIIDRNAKVKVENNLTEIVGQHRVRCILKDSLNRLWICCYGKGLIRYTDEDNIKMFTREENGAAGNYFRCLIEASNGDMIAGGSEGVTFIRGDEVIYKVTGDNGLKTTQILSMSLVDDTLYAGSDGSGIYVIKKGKVIDIVDEEDGLTSPIILRMTPYAGGYFIVTSNSLNYYKDGVGRRLDSFPYFNNFDIVIHGTDAWVLSSAGIFVVNANDLMIDNPDGYNYRLYNYSSGLQGSITANSWTYIDKDQELYFCSNVGAEKISMENKKEYSGLYKMDIQSFYADNEIITSKDNTYTLNAEVDEIMIDAAVFNYTLEDLKVRFYIKGLDENPTIVRQSELAPIHYRNIPNGTYTLCFEILNDSDEVIQELNYNIVKEQRMWETPYFHGYLRLVGVWAVCYLIWAVFTLEKFFKRKKQLEVESQELETTVSEQTRKITAMQWDMIEGMASLIESRDGNTGEHIRNTAAYVKMITEEMYKEGMYPHTINLDYIDSIAMVAPLHDVGKVKISDTILNKPGKFTKEEFEIMKTHAAIGGTIVKGIMGTEADPYLIKLAQDIATYHHERWNGSGYPYGKKETEIPLCARIMAVADVFDALVSKRVYKEGMSLDEAYDEIVRGSGTQFQPEIVDVFVRLRPRVSAYLNKIREKAKQAEEENSEKAENTETSAEEK